ncbi:hypothetical protein MVEN_01734400 [Mycena venus]|uniref:Uncharacterized protein n=1 Tax=Mycena venus TaxID=2733690 RepID=A0A8H6XMB5_9AGAR|nr:hypothetical protein MVEN_01734400 [Mycena venus]
MSINNCWTLFGIVQGCLTTIFACTWVSVHRNVPPPNQTWLSSLGWKLGMMLVAVIAPELMVGFATRQFFVARRYANEFQGLSITHRLFICMGGFMLWSGSHPIATMKQLKERPDYVGEIAHVEVEDIMDKSKGDALSKDVVLTQGLWFITQLVARVHQRLPITELEVTTLAFAILNLFV